MFVLVVEQRGEQGTDDGVEGEATVGQERRAGLETPGGRDDLGDGCTFAGELRGAIVEGGVCGSTHGLAVAALQPAEGAPGERGVAGLVGGDLEEARGEPGVGLVRE